MTRPTDTQDMTARSPEDVLAAVPILLGFVPEDSVVMLTFGAEYPFHARLDLPVNATDRQDCADMLLEPVLRHKVREVLFVIYSDDPAHAASCAQVLAPAFEREAVDVLAVVRSDGRCWFAVPWEASAAEGPGTPYDVSGHAFTARAVASGRVIRTSRAELAASVATDADAVRAVAAAALPAVVRDPAEESAWVLVTLERLVAEHGRPDPATAARILTALREPLVRDAVLEPLDRQRAEALLPLFSALARAAPTDLVAPVASVLAFLAWLTGDGALAWCALDRADESDEHSSLAGLVAEALEVALPPAGWLARR